MVKVGLLLVFAIVAMSICVTSADRQEQEQWSAATPAPKKAPVKTVKGKGTEESKPEDKTNPKNCPQQSRVPRWTCMEAHKRVVKFGDAEGVQCDHLSLCATTCKWMDKSETCLLWARDDPSYRNMCILKAENDPKLCLKSRWCRAWDTKAANAETSCAKWAPEADQNGSEQKAAEASKEKELLAQKLAATDAEIEGLQQKIEHEEELAHEEQASNMEAAAQHISDAHEHAAHLDLHDGHHEAPLQQNAPAAPATKTATTAPAAKTAVPARVSPQATTPAAKKLGPKEFYFNGGLEPITLCTGGHIKAGKFHCGKKLTISPPAPLILKHKYKEFCKKKERKSAGDNWKCTLMGEEKMPMTQEELAKLLKLRRAAMRRHIKSKLEEHYANMKQHANTKHELKSELQVEKNEIERLKHLLAQCKENCGGLKTSVNAASAHVTAAQTVAKQAAAKKASLIERIAYLKTAHLE